MSLIISAMLFASSLLPNLSTKLAEIFSPHGISRHEVAIKASVHKKVPTPVSQEKLLDILEASHVRVFGHCPKRTRLVMGWAQVSLENGRGKYIYNNNIGNIGPHKRSNHDFYNHLGNRGYPYRSFKTMEEGADVYWKTIKKCRAALAAFDSGDPKNSARSLKGCNYFMAPLEGYTRSLTSLYNEGYAKFRKSKGNR